MKPVSGERETLIARLLELAEFTASLQIEADLRKAANMLADALPTDMNRYTQATLAGHATGLAEGLAMAADAPQARELSDAKLEQIVQSAIRVHMQNYPSAAKNACVEVAHEVARAVLAARSET